MSKYSVAKDAVPNIKDEAMNIMELCNPNNGWTFFKDKGGVKCYYQKNDKSPFYMFLGEGIVDAGVDTLLSFFDKYENTKIVDSMFIEGEDIAVMDKENKICWMKYALPTPLITNRDFLFHQYSTVITDGPKIGLLIGISVTHDKCPSHKCYVRGEILLSGYLFKEVDGNPSQCHASYLVQADPKGWSPTWVVNMVSADQGLNILRLKEHFATSKDGEEKTEEKEDVRENKEEGDKADEEDKAEEEGEEDKAEEEEDDKK